MKSLALIIVLLLAGCASLSAPMKQELNDCATAGDVCQARWQTLTDAQKLGFVFRFTRFCYTEKNGLYGDPIPAAYVSSQ